MCYETASFSESFFKKCVNTFSIKNLVENKIVNLLFSIFKKIKSRPYISRDSFICFKWTFSR